MKQIVTDHDRIKELTRRDALKLLAAGTAGAMLWTSGASATPRQAVAPAVRQPGTAIDDLRYPYTLPELPYGYDALEAAIDAQTMRIHHTEHHRGYVDGLNDVMGEHPELQGETLTRLLQDLDVLPDEARDRIRNHGGGHYNHTRFWTMMSPDGPRQPSGPLAEATARDFQSFQIFRELFDQTAVNLFGSGWVWLMQRDDGALQIAQTSNQDNPLMVGFTPLFGLDVWEHACYLRYQSRRADYVEAFWRVADWTDAQERFELD